LASIDSKPEAAVAYGATGQGVKPLDASDASAITQEIAGRLGSSNADAATILDARRHAQPKEGGTIPLDENQEAEDTIFIDQEGNLSRAAEEEANAQNSSHN
jgi:hypothetical protein